PDWASNFKDDAIDQIKDGAPSDTFEAIPMVAYYEGLAVNTEIFDKYDLDLPKDWDSFTTAIDTLNENDVIPIADSLGNEPHYVWENSVLASGGADCHAKGLDDGVPDCYVDGLNLIKDLYEMDAFPEDTLTIQDDGAAREAYNNGDAAMFISGSWG